MKKNSIYKITSRLLLFCCLSLNTVHAQIEQNLKYVDVTQEIVGNAIVVSDELTKQTIFKSEIGLLKMSSIGNVFIEDNHLNFMNNLTIDRVEELHPSAKSIISLYISNNGNSIVYVVDNQDKTTPVKMYERKKKTEENNYYEPILLRQHEYPRPYGRINILGNSNDGDVIIWQESVYGTDDRLMMLDRTPSGTGEPQILSVSSGLQFWGGVSANKNFLHFSLINLHQQGETYFTYKDEKGQWIPPKAVMLNGDIARRAIVAANFDGTLLAIDNQIVFRENDRFTVIRSFTKDYLYYGNYQMTNDGKTLYLTATKDPRGLPYDISEPPLQMYDLVKITWTDDDRNPSIQVLDSANEITYRMLYDGGRVIWNTKIETSVDVDQWRKMDQKN